MKFENRRLIEGGEVYFCSFFNSGG